MGCVSLLTPVVEPDLGLRVDAQIGARVDQRRIARYRNARDVEAGLAAAFPLAQTNATPLTGP